MWEWWLKFKINVNKYQNMFLPVLKKIYIWSPDALLGLASEMQEKNDLKEINSNFLGL